MPAKAGKFTLRASEIGVGSGNTGFSVDGVGFEPDLVVIMTVGLTAENSWDLSAPVHGDMSLLSKGGPRTGLNEFWGTDIKPSSGFSNSGIIWLKTSHGGGGPAFYPANTHADGFLIGYASGFEGGYGTICYYLALKGGESGTAEIPAYQGAPSPVELGWQPGIYAVLAHGGLGASGASDLFMADFSVPSWGFGGFDNVYEGIRNGPEWMANGLSHATSVEQVRYFLDGWGDQWVFDPQLVAQSVSNSAFYYGRGPTSFSIGYTDGFPQAPYIRGEVHIIEEGLYSANELNPPDVGIPLSVDVGFTPEAVIFMGPQDHHEPDFGTVPWGGRCFGFLTEDFQCCMAWGAYSHIGSVASFCTSDFSWISNFTSTQLSDPTNPNYGTADLNPSGFTIHTQAKPKFNKYLKWVAYGFDVPGASFFEIL